MIIGILGAGQLGRMLALAGFPLGHMFRFFDPSEETPAADLAEVISGSYEDTRSLKRFAEGLDVVTYEFENVPVQTAQVLSAIVRVSPPPRALEVSQDRLVEKKFFQSLGIPTAAFVQIDSRDELLPALNTVQTPCILKTRTSGYDGKGQYTLQRITEAEEAWDRLNGKACILEAYVPFERELSVIAVRGTGRQTAFYPLTENTHHEGILRTSVSPAQKVTDKLVSQAETYAARILEALDYVGVLAIELFQVGDRLIANEMAPRVHNSGHWTIEGAEASQFENHIRALTGAPLGSTASRGYSGMVNIIGDVPDVHEILKIPGVHLHLYGKNPRPNRKLGHITLRTDHIETLHKTLPMIKHAIGL